MNCYYSNLCEDEYKCCNFCDVKNCQYRCKDDHKKCIYFIDKRKQIIDLFKSIISNGNFKLNDLCNELSICYLTLVKLLRTNDINIKQNVLNKIKEFNNAHTGEKDSK